ncbi:MAG: 4Fe-4S binding protein, partial [Clostridiales bacterium]|nr:4Fe-4S binding protein [Clostridiales bacterium]
LNSVELLGDSLEELKIHDFKIPFHKKVGFIEQYFGGDSSIAQFVNNKFGPRPVFHYEGCIGCRDCEKNCPPKAITMVEGKPVVDMKECIRCYCCQELCPQETIEIKRSWLFQTFR